MTLTIRPLHAKDRDTWGRMWTDYLVFYNTDISPQIQDITFSRLIDPNYLLQNCLMAELDGTAVGIVHYIYHAHNWHAEDVCYLQDLFADQHVRGQGIGCGHQISSNRLGMRCQYFCPSFSNTPWNLE